MKTKQKKRGFFLFAAVVMMIVSCACCGRTAVDEEQSPELTDAEIISYNEGSEKSQYVKVCMTFDKAVAVCPDKKDTLRITIAGNRIDTDDYSLAQGSGENTAELLISVEAVTDGILKISKSEKADAITGIQDASETYAAKEFELEGTIPSGVSLSAVQTGDGFVTEQVDSCWNIRSIAWVGLSENGKLIPAAETRAGEMLDGYAAVHGHEFLMEDEEEIAEKIVETLSRNYGEEYVFSCEENQITVKSTEGTGTPDIEIYEYLKINGREVVQTDAENASEEGSHETGIKKKLTDSNREVTAEEQALIDSLAVSQIDGDGIRDGKNLYRTIAITGSAMPEQQIYSLYDLQELYRISFQNEQMNQLNLTAEYEGIQGFDFMKFLELCGADLNQEQLFLSCQGTTAYSFSLEELRKENARILLALAFPGADAGQEAVLPEMLVVREGKTESIEQLSRVSLGAGETADDPEYGFHNREPYLQSADAVFTVEVYKEGAEYLGAVNTKVFTTEDMESLMREHPESVVSNYYGTIGNEEVYPYMGVGGWLDYFEGIDLHWLLMEEMGLDSMSGSAKLTGRDGQVYASIEDLSYISQDYNMEDYYVLTAEGVRIPGAVPMIACVKNGYPILPEHEHESAGYVAYNQLNQNLEKAGVATEVGVVKNHNGPFVACLGNCDGFYGGNEVETGGDCVLLQVYLSQR